MHVLIVYGSKEGQSAKIAERIAQIIRNRGLEASTYSGKAMPADFSTDGFDAAIVGGSIHIGRYPAYLRIFVTQHLDWLNKVPTAFFTVCMAIQSQNTAEREEAEKFGKRFIKTTHWHPAVIETFAGAVKYTQYNFITRFIMKQITKHEGGSTDTSQDHEYTDWDAVVRFTNRFLEKILVTAQRKEPNKRLERNSF